MGLYSDPVELNDDGIAIPYFFFLKKIPYGEIKSIRKVSFWKSLLLGMRLFKAPMYSTGALSSSVVVIETKNSVIALSPKDPDHFIKMVSNRIKLCQTRLE